MSSKSQHGVSVNRNRNPGTNGNRAEIDDDSGVSVSGNVSQSDLTSGSGSDASDEIAAANSHVRKNRQEQNPVQVNGSNNPENQSHPNPLPNRQDVQGHRPRPIELNSQNSRQEEVPVNNGLLEVQSKAEKLGEFIISQTLESNSAPTDEVEETLLRCAKQLTDKHQILFNGMMRRIRIDEDNAYSAFNTIANEIFEGEKQVVSWGRVVTFYAYGAQLALYCKEKQLLCRERIPMYVARYAKDVISKFVYEEGGWTKLCEEFPPEDEFENKIWRVLTWTAVGLGLATAAAFIASN